MSNYLQFESHFKNDKEDNEPQVKEEVQIKENQFDNVLSFSVNKAFISGFVLGIEHYLSEKPGSPI